MRRITMLAVLLIPLSASPVAAQNIATGGVPKVQWLEGKAFERQLQLDASVFWQDAPLRERLARFARAQKVAIWLDRRVDPNQPMNLRISSQPLEDVVREIARQIGCGMCVVDSVVYVGPPATAIRLANVVEQFHADLRRAPAEVRAALEKRTQTQWPILTTPREALQQLIAHSPATLSWKSLDSVPHDLMPAIQLPTLPVTHQLSLLLAGFDLSFTATSPLEIVPLPKPTSLIRTYSVAKSVLPRFQQVIARHGTANVTREGARFRVEGSAELHRQLRTALRPGKVAQEPPTKRYTLKVTQQPVGGVARQLATQLGLQLKVDAAVAAKLDTRISFQVEEVNREELLEAMLAPAGLSGKVVDGVLEVEGR